MDALATISSRTADRTWRVPLVVAVSVAFTLAMLQYSLAHGRLGYDVDYDDVCYFADGARRLDTFYEKGARAAWREFRKAPPHSPLSTGLSMSGFMLFGIQDWAPYAMNGLLLLATLLAVNWALRDADRWLWTTGMVFVLCCPFLANAVLEFRPDYAAGLFIAIASLATLEAARQNELRKCAALGALWAAAALAKPPALPFVLYMGGLAGLAGFFIRNGITVRREEVIRHLHWAARVSGLAALIAAPYFAFAYRHIISYVHAAVFSESSSIWHLDGGLSTQFSFYVTGHGGARMLGIHVWLALGLVAAAIGLLTWQKSPALRLVVSAAALTASAYVFLSLVPNKSAFLGLTFQILLVFVGLIAAREIWTIDWKPWATGALRTVMSLLLVLGVASYKPARFTSSFHLRGDESVAKCRALNREIVNVLVDAVRTSPPSTPNSDGLAKVYVTTASYVNSDMLNWLALKEKLPLEFGVPAPTASLNWLWVDDLNLIARAFDQADFVVANEPTVLATNPKLPATQVAAETLEMARQRPDFQLLAERVNLEGKRYYIFQRATPHSGIEIGRRASPNAAPRK
jgi:hypothetical protein